SVEDLRAVAGLEDAAGALNAAVVGLCAGVPVEDQRHAAGGIGQVHDGAGGIDTAAEEPGDQRTAIDVDIGRIGKDSIHLQGAPRTDVECRLGASIVDKQVAAGGGR